MLDVIKSLQEKWAIPTLFAHELIALYPDKFKNLKNNRDKSLFLTGNPGTGKTLKAIAIVLDSYTKGAAPRMLINNYCHFVNVPELLFEIQQTYKINKKYSGGTTDEQLILNKCVTPTYLILDDLGVQKTTEWSLQMLYLIINQRYVNMKKIIVTSNYSLDELSAKMGDERIVSRLAAMGGVVKQIKQLRKIN